MKVYVSSTFRDLQLHRAAVDRTLRKMGHDVIGMEQYAAENSRPVERCKRDVAIADVYVLILGWRYGYAPTEDNEGRLSVTEIEYRHARLLEKPVLAFLLDPEAPWPPSAMDSASADVAAATKLSDLRSEVGAEYLAGIFASPDELASQVAAAVASHGLSTQLSRLVLNRTAVSAESMERFGTGDHLLADTSIDAIKEMVAAVGKDRAIVVRLGEGDQWWSTRLFLLASLLRSLTQVRQIVFTGRRDHFAGMASPDALLDGLGSRFPELGLFIGRLRETEATEDRIRETDRQIDVWNSIFVGGPRPARAGAKRAASARSTAQPPRPGPEHELQVGVREELLADWLGERLITRCIEVEGSLTMSQVQQIVDCLVPDVPMELRMSQPRPGGDSTGADPGRADTGRAGVGEPGDTLAESSIKVIDRDTFALELAREWVRAGQPRNPAT